MEGAPVIRGSLAAHPRSKNTVVKDYSQAMVVALGFYLFGHLADLATTLGFLNYGNPECNYIPALVLQYGGVAALVALKIFGALGTSWVFWKLRSRYFTVIFTSLLAILLIFVASVNSLDVLEALAQAGH